MRKFMVVVQLSNDCYAAFFDKKEDADNYKMNAECGLGALAQVYEWLPHSAMYKFMYE